MADEPNTVQPNQRLFDEIYRERVLRARRIPPARKLYDGLAMFEEVCGRMRAGIKMQYPDADEKRVAELLHQRFARLRQVAEHGIYENVPSPSPSSGTRHLRKRAVGGRVMKGTEAAAALIDALETCGVPYMIVGSLSSNLFGITRSTVDADFVVELGAGDLKRVVERLGPAFSLDPQTQFETLTGTTRYIVHVAETEFKLELFCLSNDPHDRERFKRRLQMEMPDLGRIAYVPTPEDVILMKSRWARGKDRDDVRDVISVQGDAIDWDYVYHWADQHGTRGVIDEIRASIPPIDD